MEHFTPGPLPCRGVRCAAGYRRGRYSGLGALLNRESRQARVAQLPRPGHCRFRGMARKLSCDLRFDGVPSDREGTKEEKYDGTAHYRSTHCFCSEAVHYSPWTPKWSGAATIGNNFAKVVREQGISWTVDQLLIDVDQSAAALEWTGFNRQQARIVRGVDWFVFEPHTLCIQEIRPYAAAPIHPDKPRQELLDFDYVGRGYPTTFPAKN